MLVALSLSVALMAAPEVAPLSPEQAAVEAVKGSLPLVKTRAVRKTGDYASLTDEARKLGHNGKVTVSGVLGVDGKLTALHVSRSSGSPLLDDAALVAARSWSFDPALDAEGKPLAVPIKLPFEFFAYKPADGTGISGYRCDQFVLDQDWWRSSHPNSTTRSDNELYSMMLGLGMITSGALNDVGKLKTAVSDFEKRWDAAIATCRRSPDKRFVEVLKPEGPQAEALAKRGML